MAINPTTTDSGVCNIHIDNITGVFVDNPWMRPRARAVITLAIHAVGRRNSSTEHILRIDLIATAKMTTEAALSKTKPLLGWILNIRSFTIKLPEHKHKAWLESLRELLQTWQATHDQLEVMVGCLRHLPVVMQPVLHFLSRLCHLMKYASHKQGVHPLPDACVDARLFLLVLTKQPPE